MRDFANLPAGGWLARLTGQAGLAMLFAAVLAFLAPFGTYRFDAIERIGYWTLLMAAWLVLSLIASGLVRRVPGWRSRGPAQRRVISTIVASLPMIVVTGVANNMMNGWRPDGSEVAELFVSILLIGGGYAYLSDRLLGGLFDGQARAAAFVAERGVEQESAPTEQGPADTTLIDRLPAHVRGGILCLQVEDHYVRVHARQGSAMVLMRFSDALRGIGHLPGSQVHRSWWVASGAVTGMRRTGRTAQLTLSNGISVPVSQPYLAEVTSRWGSLEAERCD